MQVNVEWIDKTTVKVGRFTIHNVKVEPETVVDFYIDKELEARANEN